MADDRAIWKFPLQVVDRQTLTMPAGAKLLDIQMQHGVPCLWAMVPEARAGAHQQPVEIRIVGTGHLFDATGREYLGTFQMDGGALVFHAFRNWLAEDRALDIVAGVDG